MGDYIIIALQQRGARRKRPLHQEAGERFAIPPVKRRSLNTDECPFGVRATWGNRGTHGTFPVACSHSSRETPGQSADRSDRKLLADLSRQAIVDLGVARDWSFGAAGRIGVDRVSATFTVQPTPLILQVADQLVPLQARGVPT